MGADRYYVIEVWGGVEPSLGDPCPTPEARDDAARESFRKASEEDNVFWLDLVVLPDGTVEPRIGPFTNHFVEDSWVDPG